MSLRCMQRSLAALWVLSALLMHAQEKPSDDVPSGKAPYDIRICLARVTNETGRIFNMGLARQRLAGRLDGRGSLRAVELDSVREAEVRDEAREQQCSYLLEVELLTIFDTGERSPAGGPLPELDRTPAQAPRTEHTAAARFYLSEVGAKRALAQRRIIARQFGREANVVERAMDEVARQVLRELAKRHKRLDER